MGLLQITSRLGAAGAPWVGKYLKRVHPYAPFAVMGGSAIISAFTLLYLPETKGAVTAETLEAHGKKPSPVGYQKELDNINANINLAFATSGDNTKL